MATRDIAIFQIHYVIRISFISTSAVAPIVTNLPKVAHAKLSSLGLDSDLNLRRSKFSTHTIRNIFLLENEVNTVMSDSGLSPALESRCLLKESRQFSTDKSMFGLTECQQAKYKRPSLNLSDSESLLVKFFLQQGTLM